MMNRVPVKIFTIGCTGKSAEEFFGLLKRADIKKLIDTRLWAGSQLAGFARKKDLPFLTRELVEVAYEYREDLAPTQCILKAYKDQRINWDEYEMQYRDVIRHRNVENLLSPDEGDGACFLCACEDIGCCHRRVLAEYLQDQWGVPLEIVHL